MCESSIIEPIADEDLWGVPVDELAESESEQQGTCPLARVICPLWDRGECQAGQCLLADMVG